MTSEPSYTVLREHYERTFREHGDSHRGVDWPNAADATTRYDVMLDLLGSSPDKVSLLDVGCGLAHLFDRIVESGREASIDYEGMDISETFVAACRQKHPEIVFHHADLLAHADAPAFGRQFDYVIMNGVFTEKLTLSHEQMVTFFKALLTASFGLARRGLAFNVMTKHVDWERDDLFHLSFDEMAALVGPALTRYYTIRSDYGLRDYTVYLYRR